jgi:hypothetical protein
MSQVGKDCFRAWPQPAAPMYTSACRNSHYHRHVAAAFG